MSSAAVALPKTDAVDDLFPDEDVPLSPEEVEAVVHLAPRMMEIFAASGAQLPPFPKAAARVYELASQPEPETAEVVRVLGTDPMLSAQILRAANSAYYARSGRVGIVRDAVVRLGAREVARVAALVSASVLFDAGERRAQTVAAPVWQRLWLHSITTALGACAVALKGRRIKSEEAFLGGLLHDVGKIAGLRALAGYVLAGNAPAGLTDAVVVEVLEISHEEVGAHVAKVCDLPPEVSSYTSTLHSATPATNEARAVLLASSVEALLAGDRGRAQHRQDIRRAASGLDIDEFAIRAFATDIKAYATRAASMAGAVR